eukprot:TRINITY_DN8161_c0_g1_i4.p1 TRINITY_DN8161_c0_g1~~TRINITY_DN8161_c0_g1_i4.p1  ORF type:complete len:457 (-),score=81.01 TRINITY_DN8161_c0_g1_i4:109-1479(-)
MLSSVMSFGSCYLVSDSAKFFLVPFRAWEFLVGAFVWLIEYRSPFPSSQNKIPELVPVLMTVFLVLISPFIPNDSYPNGYTLVVVLITAATILCGKKNFQFSVLEKIGDVSYSLYLYHWPVIRFLNPLFLHHSMRKKEFFFHLSTFCLFEICTWLSFWFVEGPSRRSKLSARAWLVVFFFSVTLVVGSVMTIVPPPEAVAYEQVDLNIEGDEEKVQILLENVRRNKLWGFDIPGWVKGKQLLWQVGSPNKCILLVGDSHAIMYLQTLERFSKKHNLTLWLDAEPAWQTSESSNKFFIRESFPYVPVEFMNCEKKIIFMVSSSPDNYPSFYTSRDYMLKHSGGNGTDGCVIHPSRIYYPTTDPVTCILDGKVPLSKCRLDVGRPRWETIPEKVKPVPGHHVMEVNDLICPEFPCLYYHGVIPKWKDTGHLTRQIVDLITPKLISRMESYTCVEQLVK